MKTIPADASPLPAERLRFLLWSLALLVLPHLWHLHWSHTALFLGFWSWRLGGCRWPQILPRGVWLPLLTLAAVTVVVISRHGAVDLTTSTGLFVAGLGLKLMELKGMRDIYIAVFLGWFVALTQFLYDQSLPMAGYALGAVALLTASLIQFNAPRPLSWHRLTHVVSSLMVPALPLMVVLFLFFPRLSGPFFHLPVDNYAKTGLTEVMEPGAIANLITSPEIAFRVDFDGEIPPPGERYWRAQVFWRFDGRRWLPLPAAQQPLPQVFPGHGVGYRYHVTVEPHHRHWLSSLGIPGSVPPGSSLTREGVLRSLRPVDERIRYSLRSYPHYRFPSLSVQERHWALQLPGQPTARIRFLVDGWLRQTEDPRQLAAAVLKYFHDQDFTYTLHPPLLASSPIDRFLFESRKGFCEHYATAFVYLMRVAGVPARVVGGYSGGYLNPQGGFLEVYQANAHAWAEIWSDDEGWIRYDPTQAVAPRYLEYTQNLPEPVVSGSEMKNLIAGTISAQMISGGVAWWRTWQRTVRIFWSDLDHRWHRWVLSYSQQNQQRLLSWFKSRWPFLVLPLMGVLGAYLWFQLTKGSTDPLGREYHRFLKRLQHYGLNKAPQETPLMFAHRASLQCPDKASLIQEITQVYVQARYGRRRNSGAIKKIRSLSAHINKYH